MFCDAVPIYIALLRGINVGGRQRIAMADLSAALGTLNFHNVKTLLQSGNVVFRADKRSSAVIEKTIESAIADRLKLKIDCIVRTPDEWKSIITENPFRAEAQRDPSHMLVEFFRVPLNTADVETLRAAIKGPELIHANGRELYLVYPAGIGTSKLTGALIEKTLRARGTARNWNTILKLAAYSAELEA